MKAGISKKTHYNWLDADAAHAAEYAEVAEDVTQTLEHEARRLASERWEAPVYYKGKVVGHVRKFSNVLLIFLLKARRPDVYRERQDLSAAHRLHGRIRSRHTHDNASRIARSREHRDRRRLTGKRRVAPMADRNHWNP